MPLRKMPTLSRRAARVLEGISISFVYSRRKIVWIGAFQCWPLEEIKFPKVSPGNTPENNSSLGKAEGALENKTKRYLDTQRRKTVYWHSHTVDAADTLISILRVLLQSTCASASYLHSNQRSGCLYPFPVARNTVAPRDGVSYPKATWITNRIWVQPYPLIANI